MQLEVLFVLQLMLTVLVIILLIKLVQLKKVVTQTVEDVKGYITFITEDINEETTEISAHSEENIIYKTGLSDVSQKKARCNEKTQSQIIHAVLQEYFP